MVDNSQVGGIQRTAGGRVIFAGPPQGGRSDSALYSLELGTMFRTLTRQPASFWFVMLYLFFEYVRPQQIYEAMEGPPYALISIVLALGFLLIERRPMKFGTPELLLGIFTLIVLASSLTAFQPGASYDKLSLFLSWILIYMLIVNAVDTEEKFFLFIVAFLLYSFKMSQHGTRSWIQAGFSFRDWGTTGAPGWFQNSGEFGIQMCIFLPLVVAFIIALKRWWKPWKTVAWWMVTATAVTGIIASSSRGALIGLAALLLWMLTKSRRILRGLVAACVVAAAVYLVLPAEQKSRLREMGEDKTSVLRSTYWKNGVEIMNDHPVLGIGYANWPEYHAINYGVRALPHNIFIEAGAELGYTGLAAFIGLIICTFVLNRKTRKLALEAGSDGDFVAMMAHGVDGALVGFIVSGFFVTVLYYPFFWINLAMAVSLNRVALSLLPIEERARLTQRQPVSPAAVRRYYGAA